MSKADDMFLYEHFCKIKDNEYRIVYENINSHEYIEFDKDFKKIKFNNLLSINIQELKAINEKVKELGWEE